MARDVMETINDYVTDMLALENHIEKALEAQINSFRDDYPEITAQLQSIHARCEIHLRDLKALAEEQGDGGGFAEALKRAGATLAGLGAAAIDKVRTERLPRNLRDDFTALNLAAIGYAMLFTTARALDDPRVAELAQRHFRDHAESVVRLHGVIPVAVVEFLQREGLPVRTEVLPDVVRELEDAWREVSIPITGERLAEAPPRTPRPVTEPARRPTGAPRR